MPVKKKAVKKKAVKRAVKQYVRIPAPKATASNFIELLDVYMRDMRAADVLRFIDKWSVLMRAGPHTRESDLLWDMLTVLRGPDLDDSQMGAIARARGLEPPITTAGGIKWATTARLRALMFPKDFGTGVADKNFDGKPVDEDVASPIGPHFQSHIASAITAVKSL